MNPVQDASLLTPKGKSTFLKLAASEVFSSVLIYVAMRMTQILPGFELAVTAAFFLVGMLISFGAAYFISQAERVEANK